MSAENLAFTERCIARLQRMSIDDGLLAQSLHDYLVRMGRVGYDHGRNLFWVSHPSQPAQVAVWMMPVCIAAEAA